MKELQIQAPHMWSINECSIAFYPPVAWLLLTVIINVYDLDMSV